MKKIILGGVILLFLILNFVLIPDYYRVATKINAQAVQIDTFTYFQINEGENRSKGYCQMEKVDLIQTEKDVWKVYDCITSELLWTRNTTGKKLIVQSSTCLLELGEKIIVDSLSPQSILSRINLETGELLWEKNLSVLQQDWDLIELRDTSSGEYLQQLEEGAKVRVAKGKSTILATFYQNDHFGEILLGEYVIDIKTGRALRLNTSASAYRRDIEKISFEEIVSKSGWDWSSIEYYSEEELFLDTKSRRFFEVKKGLDLMKGKVYVFATPTHYVFVQEGTFLNSENNIHAISNVKANQKWQGVAYDLGDALLVERNHLTLYNDKMYSIYNISDLERLEIVEPKDRRYMDERFRLEMEEEEVKWIIEESNYSIYVNRINTEQIKELRMNLWKGERFFRKKGNWMYIYETDESVEAKYQTKQLYKYKVPFHFESQ